MFGFSDEEVIDLKTNIVNQPVQIELQKRNVSNEQQLKIQAKLVEKTRDIIIEIEKAKSEYDKKVRKEERKYPLRLRPL